MDGPISPRPVTGPSPAAAPRPSAAPRPVKAKPDPRPMRLVLGASGLAALSALVTGIVLPPNTGSAYTGSTTVQVQNPVQYVQLKPGQTAPPGATVINGTAQSGTLVNSVAAPAQKPIIIKTTQSGRVVK